MAAAQALNIVSQIQLLADGPESPEMRQCLGQVVSSLQFFLEHPDSRVRLNAARTLVKLVRGYPAEVGRTDLSRVRTSLDRLQAAQKEGNAGVDAEELIGLLLRILGEPFSSGTDAALAASSASAASASLGAAPTEVAPPAAAGHGSEARGEVVLNTGEGADSKMKVLILDKVVKMQGVVSVTFDTHHVVITTLTSAIAADASFLADVLTAVTSSGLKGVTLVRTTAASAVDGTDTAGGATCSSSLGGGGSAAAASDSAGGGELAHDATTPMPTYLDDDEDREPGYLDDDEDEIHRGLGSDQPSQGALGGSGASGLTGMGGGAGYGGVGGPGQPQFSFFSQSNWMTSRRVAEFAGDDPSIAARLSKAKKKQQERKQEESSRLGRLFSALSGR
jgi:hypothetical protein